MTVRSRTTRPSRRWIAPWLALSALLCGPARADTRFLTEEASTRQVLALIEARLELMPQVAAWKWLHHVGVTDPARERAVVAAAEKDAAALGLAPGPVGELFALEMSLARAVENDLEERWRARGFDFIGTPADLTSELRPRLDRLTAEQLRALHLAVPATRRPDFAVHYAPLAAQSLRAGGFTPERRAQLLAILGKLERVPSPALARIRASGVLRIGTTGDYAPFSFEQAGRLGGSDVVLAAQLARALGVAAVFVRTSWPALLDDFARGDFDVAVGGISATPARQAAGILSRSYLSGGKTIIARCADATSLASLDAIDRPGVRVVVNPGGTNEQYVRAHLKRASVRIVADNTATFGEILAGRADAMITDDVEVELQTRRHPELCRTYAGLLTHADKVLLVARDPALGEAIDAWLAPQIAAGVPAQLLSAALSQSAPR